MEENEISDSGAIALSESLYKFIQLRNLNISVNHIGDTGAKALADNIDFCSRNHFQSLIISFNHISDTGAIALAEGFNHVTCFKLLAVGCNEIGDDGAIAITRAIKHIKDLKFQVWNHKITKYGAITILKLKHDVDGYFQILTLDSEMLGNSKMSTLVINMRHDMHSNSVQILNLNNSQISVKNTQSLADVLQYCNNLHTLNLEWNTFQGESVKILANGLTHCARLQTLT